MISVIFQFGLDSRRAQQRSRESVLDTITLEPPDIERARRGTFSLIKLISVTLHWRVLNLVRLIFLVVFAPSPERVL